MCAYRNKTVLREVIPVRQFYFTKSNVYQQYEILL